MVSDVEIESEYQFERRIFGSSPEQLRTLAAWLLEKEAEEVVMESTAQYWKPVWEALERYWKPIREKREGAKLNRRMWTRMMYGGVAGCVKKMRKRHAVREMKVGPSESSCRRGLQTAVSCYGQMPQW